jgi:hypothetical protein
LSPGKLSRDAPRLASRRLFDERDPVVRFKLDLLRRALPARDAIVYGDTFQVDGAYTAKCLEHGCERALLVATLETPRLLRLRLENPTLDFAKGDFSDPFFMATIRRQYEIGVAFDVLLHQAPLVHTLHLMLSKVGKRLAIAQPMLEEQPSPNALIYLPGNTDTDLHPVPGEGSSFRIFDVDQVIHPYWLWGMTRSFLRSALVGEGFEVTHEETLAPWPNERWSWCGFIAERRDRPISHWSRHHTFSDLYEEPWPGEPADDGRGVETTSSPARDGSQ